MTIPKLNLSRLFPWLLIVALILMFAYCQNRGAKERQVLKDRADMSDSLRKDAGEDRVRLARQLWEYDNNQKTYQYQAQQAGKRADSIQRVARGQTAEIRALYAELGRPWPVDTVEIASKCCEVAVKLADSFDSLQVADNLKDVAYMAQIDLSTYMVDTLNQALKRENARYDKLDSLNKRYQLGAKLRGSLWGGLRAAVGPVSSAGGWLKWQTAGGKEYGGGVGRIGGGWYIEGTVGVKFSFKRIR
jgi:hypothetical protein